MSETTCNACESYSCGGDIEQCVSTILLGRIAYTSTQVYVHVIKQNGAEYIQAVTSDSSGYVTLDVTVPDCDFYNAFDGTYIVYIMRGGYFNDGDKVTVTCPGGTYTAVGFKFRNTLGAAYTTQHIQLI